MRKKLLTRTALAATIALGIGSFNLAYAAETEDTSSGKKINVMASFYPMYDFATKVGGIRLRLPIWYLPSDLTQDAWINVTGTYHYDKHKGMEITVTDIEDAEPSEEEYVYPIY